MEALKISDYRSCSLPDTLIVQRILSGEKELFEILLRRYNQRLFRAVRSYLKDSDDIEDAMQETYLHAYEKLYQFKGSAAFSTWLVRIGINEALLRVRKLKKSQALYKEGEGSALENNIQLPDSKQMNPEKQAINSEIRLLIEQAIDQLPEKYRAVYVLKEVEGMENSEIALCLGLSDSNIKVRLHRAKNLLKEALYKRSADTSIFEFGNSRCDRLVAYVMERI